MVESDHNANRGGAWLSQERKAKRGSMPLSQKAGNIHHTQVPVGSRYLSAGLPHRLRGHPRGLDEISITVRHWPRPHGLDIFCAATGS